MKIIIIVVGVYILMWFIVSFMIIHDLSREIEKNGGLGKSIGGFINDIQTEIEK